MAEEGETDEGPGEDYINYKEHSDDDASSEEKGEGTAKAETEEEEKEVLEGDRGSSDDPQLHGRHDLYFGRDSTNLASLYFTEADKKVTTLIPLRLTDPLRLRTERSALGFQVIKINCWVNWTI